MTTVQAASRETMEKGNVRPSPVQTPDDREKSGKPPEGAPTVAGVNLQKLADEELVELRKSLDIEITSRQEKATTQLIAEFRAKAEKLGLDPVTVAAMLAPRASARGRRGSGDKRGTVAKKYRNPADPSQTWAGRGKPPSWIELAPPQPGEKRGKPLPKFLIPDTQ